MLLILMRHGEAEAGGMLGRDHDRRLTERGKSQVEVVAQALHTFFQALPQEDALPSVLYSSSARRCLDSSELIQEVFGRKQHDVSLSVRKDFYHAGLENIQNFVVEQDLEHTSSLFLQGHNPGWSDTAFQLTGESSVHLATGDAVVMQQPHRLTWQEALEKMHSWTLLTRISAHS